MKNASPARTALNYERNCLLVLDRSRLSESDLPIKCRTCVSLERFADYSFSEEDSETKPA
jgi:hypothetical protein